MSEKPLVSVVCVAYNHERYILDALEGIASQVTSFPFEVIIHDDASTDGTQRLVEEYLESNGLKAKTVFQKTNIYSQGKTYIEYVDSMVEGKYVAICEGDDYWTDPTKLQRQCAYMESHPNCSAVVHDADIFDMARSRVIGRVTNSDEEADYSLDHVIRAGGGLYPTCSILCRRELFKLPAEFCGWGIGDYPRSIWFAENGPIHYIPCVMAVYRYGTAGSWTMRIRDEGQSKKELEIRVEKLKELDGLRGGRYSDAINYAISKTWFFRNIEFYDWGSAVRDLGATFYHSLSPVEKGKYWVRTHFPKLFHLIKSAVVR